MFTYVVISSKVKANNVCYFLLDLFTSVDESLLGH